MKTTPELTHALMEYYQASAAKDHIEPDLPKLPPDQALAALEKVLERVHAAKVEVQVQIIRADPELQALGAAPQLARMTPEAWAALKAFYETGALLLKAMQKADLSAADAQRILPRYQQAARAMSIARDALYMNSKVNGVSR